MNLPTAQTDSRPAAGRELGPPGPANPPRPTPPLVGAVWALLVVNALGSTGATIVPIPRSLLQLITMGSLAVAFTLALLLNRSLRIRPSGFLLLFSLLVVVSTLSSVVEGAGGIGAPARCARFAMFVATLWLLTRWWGDGMAFLRYHIRISCGVLATVAVGLLLAPGSARPADFDSRLVGVLWPIPATQVGDYGAVVAGLVIVLWMARCTSGWSVIGIAAPAILLLLLSHTRTATIGLLVAVAVAGLALALASARARRFLTVVVLLAAVVPLGLTTHLTTWYHRGQDQSELSDLTGRQQVWDSLLAAERSPQETLVGVGLTDKSFGGLPIDSTWLSVYHEQGLVGVVLIGSVFVGAALAAILRPPSPARACALFLIVYCMVASYTQTGIGDVSSYFVHFGLAVILLSVPDSPTRSPAVASSGPAEVQA